MLIWLYAVFRLLHYKQ